MTEPLPMVSLADPQPQPAREMLLAQLTDGNFRLYGRAPGDRPRLLAEFTPETARQLVASLQKALDP